MHRAIGRMAAARRGLAAFFVAAAVCLLPARARTEAVTFFAGTQYATEVHYVRGAQPGPTIMVQGGIQGDEFCGYLTAQLLTHAEVTRGTLIIVPRANPPAVNVRRRQVNVDMNRRFDRDYEAFYEDNLARLVRFLADQSRGVIHLHEGSGFYNPVRLDDLRGPRRYGQSVVIDAAACGGFALERTVRQVIAQLNAGLTPRKYAFKLFNQDTFDERSKWPEQRRSLTYYAMSRGVPALDVEVSKNLVGPYWTWWKVTQQLRATELFLRALGVELRVDAPRLRDFETYPPRGAALTLNGQTVDPADPRVTLRPGEPLDVRLSAAVSDVPPASGPADAAGETATPGGSGGVDGAGLPGGPLAPIPCVTASDRAGVNLLRGPRLPLTPFTSLGLTADGLPLLTARISWTGAPAPDVAPRAEDGDLLCWLNGRLTAVRPGGTLRAVEGDQLILEGVAGSARPEVLNLKGYVSHPGRDDGQDAGGEIVLDAAMFQPRYVLRRSPQEMVCEIVRETPGVNPRPRFFLRIEPRRVTELVLTGADGREVRAQWSPGQWLRLAPGRYRLTDIQGNGAADKIQAFWNGMPVRLGGTFTVPDAEGGALVLRQTTTFRELGRMPVSGGEAVASGPANADAPDGAIGSGAVSRNGG